MKAVNLDDQRPARYQPSHFRHPIRGANIGEKSVQNRKINEMCRR